MDNEGNDYLGEPEDYSYDYNALIARARKLDTPPSVTLAFGVLFTVIIIVGNIWVIIAVFNQPKLRKSATNLFIVSLSVSDLMVAVFFIPYHVAFYAYNIPIRNSVFCKVTGYLHWASQCGTTFSLICIGIDRYRAIVQPMRPRLTVQHAAIGCTVVWMCALGYSSFKLSVNDVIFDNHTTSIQRGNDTFYEYEQVYFCHVADEDTDHWFRLADLIIMYTLPLLILTILYSIMVFTLWFSKSPTNSSSRNKKKAVKMLSFVVLQFALTWLPNHTLQFYYTWNTTYPKNEFVWSNVPSNLAIFIFVCNSWINPFLYAYFNENFRKEFKKMFPCFYNCRNSRVAPEDTGNVRSGPTSQTRTGFGVRTQVSIVGNTVS
ncbi:galanin receptor 2a-like [Saccoglossus kowalevskii]|uniref:Neuropeptide FF receptor 2-like n=1 Tax=Saccoglossus kowalevskii TaxID=10224 RepID=A0ABM0H188_SACKO|nr:PREDICTED: neuropeptide FF receptor 2-like [Saccoglossus kowalevskii]